jgi:tRNA G18 (ribose-2'-O)-methylase SpoU
MGALFRLNILTNINQQMISDLLERDGASLWAADMDGAEILPQVNDERFILAFGSESHGLPNKVRQAASGIIGIKKNGYGESLNLAVAAGIILSRIRGQSGS